MTDQELLDELSKQLGELEEKGLTDTPEYEKISDQYQDLAQDMVLSEIFRALT
jgi:hypothetical protein